MNFDEIYKLYCQRIFRLCMGYVNDVEIANDMVQETFIIVWEQLPKFRNEALISTWIFRIATNRCLQHIKLNDRLPLDKLLDVYVDENQNDVESDMQFLYQCISELREMDRIIISLELENVNQAEIAQIVGLSEGNIRVRIYRIKQTLTKKFKRHG